MDFHIEASNSMLNVQCIIILFWHEFHIVQRTQFMDIQNTKFPRNDTDLLVGEDLLPV